MTPSELKYLHEESEPGSHFFDRKTMRFFGDTMRNFGVRKVEISVLGDAAPGGRRWPEKIQAWELYRKRAVKHGLRKSAFFDMEGRQVHAIDPELN